MRSPIVVLLLVLCSAIATASEPMWVPPIDGSWPGGTAVDAAYTVTFDGEGEAIVLGRITLWNQEDRSITTMRLEVPGRDTRVVGVMQRVGDGYERISVDVEHLSESTIIPLRLAQGVAPQEQAEIIMMYKQDGLVSTWLGASDFRYETPKHKYDTRSIRVGVNAPDGQVLEGAGRVAYRSNFLMAAEAFASSDVAKFRGYMGDIGNGQLAKSASYLDPQENYIVEGTYATSALRLSWGWAIVVMAMLGAAVWGGVRGWRRLRALPKKGVTLVTPALAGAGAGVALFVLWTIVIAIAGAAQSMPVVSEELLTVMLVFLASLLSLGVLLGVPIVVGSRLGATAGLVCAGAMVLALMLLSLPMAMLYEWMLRTMFGRYY